jgi:Phage integrase, N-terminal SAM-like domain
VFYGKKVPLLIHAFKGILFPPLTAKLSVFYYFYWRGQPPMTTMSQQPPSPQPPEKPLLEQMRDALRVRPYSIRTETSYLDWAGPFIPFPHKRHAETMAAPEITAFLTHLAVAQTVAASTQTQALSALLFLYSAGGVERAPRDRLTNRIRGI